MSDKFILADRGRDPEHSKLMHEIAESGLCPFCEKSFFKKTGQEIILENEFWFVVPNIKPYDDTKLHLMFISQEHAQSPFDLTPEAGKALFEILRKIEIDYNISSGAMFMRFGDPLYNGGSVHHLHAHIIVPDVGADKDWDKIRVKLGENPK